MANNTIAQLRSKHGMSQEELAEKVFVTRQAVSRWENGETTPNRETLKLLELFDVSTNTLLGSPRKLICRCCGMPLKNDSLFGHDKKKAQSTKIIANGVTPTALSPTATWTI